MALPMGPNLASPKEPPNLSLYRRAAIVLGVAIAVTLAWVLRGVLVPLFLAFLVAYALDPAVDWLEARRVPRSLGAILIMGGISLLVLGALMVGIPYLLDEFRRAGGELPAQLEALRLRAEPFLRESLHIELPRTWGEVASKLDTELNARSPELLQGAFVALFGTLNVILIAIGALIIPLFALYLLIDFDSNRERVKRLVPRRFAPFVESVASEIHGTLGSYVRGQLMANLILAALYAIGLKIIGLRLAIPIGILTGLLAFVPYVGFGLGMLMALTMALLDWHGVDRVAATVGVMLAVQVLDGTLITPRIVGESVGLRPIEVLLTMMAAATLFGFLGVLLAVPLGAVVKILVSRATKIYLASNYYQWIPPSSTKDEAA